MKESVYKSYDELSELQNHRRRRWHEPEHRKKLVEDSQIRQKAVKHIFRSTFPRPIYVQE